MTTNIEQEFMKVFGIEDKEVLNYSENGFIEHTYKTTEITSDILLELVCILNSIYDCGVKNNTSLSSKKVEFLKMEILNYCILYKQQLKHQVQSLFTEENKDER